MKRWKGYTSVQCTLSAIPVRSQGPNWIVTIDLALVTDVGKARNLTVEVAVAAVNSEMKIAGFTEM